MNASPELGRPPVMLDIVEEHFEELDFLWELREGILFAPDWNLAELAEHEERCEAHLDGLRLAELHAVDLARPHLAGETFAATAATFVLLETGVPEFQGEVIDALQNAGDEARDGIRIGLRHSKAAPLAEALQHLAASGEAAVRAASLDVLAFHRFAAPREVLDLLEDPDDAVRRLAYGATGRLGTPLDPKYLDAALASEDPSLRRAALEAFARLGTPGFVGLCRRSLGSQNAVPEALAFLGALGDPKDFALLERALENPDLVVAAIQGLGALGNVAAIPLLIDAMGNPELALAAGAAFTRITGEDDITAEKPPPPPADEIDEEEESADEELPPDPALAQVRWEALAPTLNPGARWQSAREVAADPLGPAFRELPLETRRDLYLGGRGSGLPLPDLELERRAVLQG